MASLAWRALPAWIWPAPHLHDRPARMRASLATGLMSWSFLVGLGLVFAQLTQLQGYRPQAIRSSAGATRSSTPPWPSRSWPRASAACRCGCSCCASAAVIVAVVGLCLWAPGFAGHHQATVPGIFLAPVTAAGP